MKAHEFKRLLDRYASGECTPEESAIVEEWYENMGKAGQMSTADRAHLEEQLWRKVAANMKNTRKPVRYAIVARVAAAALVAVASGWALFTQLNTPTTVQQVAEEAPVVPPGFREVVNATQAPIDVVLTDGSVVVLNPMSNIRFTEQADALKREVFLDGEAFFDVKRDEARPFFVYSKELVTKVLGTSFTIRAYETDKEVTVKVKSGKVSVYHPAAGEQEKVAEKKAVVLKPNQQAVYDRTRELVVKQLVEMPEIILPDSKLFQMSFEEEPVAEIFKVLEAHYGVDIVFDEDSLSRCTLTTAMSEEGLYERVEVICKAIKAQYTVTEGMIFIESPGCH